MSVFANSALFLVLLCCCAPRGSDGVKKEGKLLLLTEKDFDLVTKYYTHVLVTFHASWCGVCDKFKKDLKLASEKMAEDPNKRLRKVKIAMVNGDTEKALIQRFGIFAFPTVKFYAYGNPMEYKGGMGAKRIVRWIKRKLKTF